MRIAVYPGSFDPVTVGHLDIVDRALALFDELVVAVVRNPGKSPMFTLEERQQMIQQVLEGRPRVRVLCYAGLLVDFVRSQGATAIVKGLRGVADFESELQMAQVNRHLAPNVDTVFLPTGSTVACVNSRFVREIASLGGSVRGLVPPHVEEIMLRRLGAPVSSEGGRPQDPPPPAAPASGQGGHQAP